MTTINTNTAFTPSALLLRIPPCPFDGAFECFERARADVRHARLRDLGAVVKKASSDMEAQAADFTQRAHNAAHQEAGHIATANERLAESALCEHGGIEPIMADLDGWRTALTASAQGLRAQADVARRERETALEQTQAVARQRARRGHSLLRRMLDWLLRRTPNQLTRSELEHAHRAARIRLEIIRADSAETMAKSALARLDQMIDGYRRDRDEIAASCNGAQTRQRARESNARTISTMRVTPTLAEVCDLVQPLCTDQARMRSLAQRVLRQHRTGQGSLDTIMLEEARLEANTAALPADLRSWMASITPARRASMFDSVMTEALAHLPVQWLEAPMSERHRWRILAVPGGESAPFHEELAANNPERVTTFTVDSSLESPDQVRAVDCEIGLGFCQVPLLVEARISTPDDRIKQAMLWPDPEQMIEVEFELAAKQLDNESAAWRRLALGLALDVIEIDAGAWCRTTGTPTLNGAARQRLGQGVEAAVATLRAGELAHAIAVAIENQLAALGANQALSAIEKIDEFRIPAEHLDKVRDVLATERQRLRRELLLA